MNILLNKIINFIEDIGLKYHFETIEGDTFLPGLKLRDGALVIDADKLLYTGDILHEAGHLACMPAEIRATMSDALENNDMHQGGEIMAIAWSYAACIHLGIDPYVVFHEHGYKGGGQNIVESYQNGSTMGIPLLQVCGMTYDSVNAEKLNQKPFPQMISWTCVHNIHACN